VTRRRLIPVLVIVALVVLELAFLAWKWRRPAPVPQAAPLQGIPAVAVHVMGDVEVSPRDHDEWRAVRTGDRILEGERVRTGDSGSLELDLTGKCKLACGPGTRLRCTALADPDADTSAGIRLDLDRGAMMVTVAKMERKDRFRVVTPSAVAGVRGTKFLITVEETPGSGDR
jgi:hypothetical protein